MVRTLAFLAKSQSSVPRTHMVSHSQQFQRIWHPSFSLLSRQERMWCWYTCRQNTHVHKILPRGNYNTPKNIKLCFITKWLSFLSLNLLMKKKTTLISAVQYFCYFCAYVCAHKHTHVLMCELCLCEDDILTFDHKGPRLGCLYPPSHPDSLLPPPLQL